MAWYNSSTKWSGKTKYGGKTVNNGTRAILEAANVILQNSPHYGREKEGMTIVQGSYNGGGVAASAGTHDGGGAFDLTPFNDKNRVKVLRLLGTTTNIRPTIRGLWSRHLHGIVVGDGSASRGAKGQATEYLGGGDGLRGNAKDPDWRPSVLPILFVAPWDSRGKPGKRYLTKDQTRRSQPSSKSSSRGSSKKGALFTVAAVLNVKGTLWAVNIEGDFLPASGLTTKKPSTPKPPTPKPTPKRNTWRLATFNMPDSASGKMPGDEGQRIAQMHAILADRNLDAIAIQEAVGREGKDDPSDFAAEIAERFGKAWTLVVPTTNYNENYWLVNSATAEFEQHADAKIYGTVGGKTLGGRHVSLITLNSKGGLGEIDLGNTHLINDNLPGAEVQAGLSASSLSKVGDEAARPRALLGDFNTPGPLSALSAAGLRNTRLVAAATTNRDVSTYQGKTRSTPASDGRWIIDGVWASNHFGVTGYTVETDLVSGKFRTPRTSDHLPVITALEPL